MVDKEEGNKDKDLRALGAAATETYLNRFAARGQLGESNNVAEKHGDFFKFLSFDRVMNLKLLGDHPNQARIRFRMVQNGKVCARQGIGAKKSFLLI